MLNIESKFQLGEIVATTGVADLMKKNPEFNSFCIESLMRHAQCDWGETCESDKKLNDEALINGTRIMSVYCYLNDDTSLMGRKIWIITEADRSSTTILFPSDY
jgi:hypothetical protein